MGVNYYGMMASTQRIRNLFDPLLNKPELSVSNLLINEQEVDIKKSKVSLEKLGYNYKNIISIIPYLFKGTKYIIKSKKKNRT